MRVSLGDALHLRRDDAEARVLELGDGGEAVGIRDAEVMAQGGLEDGGIRRSGFGIRGGR